MKSLYEIADEWREILNLAQEKDIDEQVIRDTLDSMDLTKDLAQKVENYWHVIDELEASNERIKKEIDRLQARRTTQGNNVKRLKNTLTGVLDYLEIAKVKTDTSTIWVQNNPESLQIINEENIPNRFWVEQPPKLDRRELLKQMKESKEKVPGVTIKQTRGVRRR